MPKDILMNEQDIKNKILQPFLEALGISADELQYETAFSIRLGLTEYEIGKKNLARGRSDILYKRDGHNIFVVEVKSDSHDVTNEDIEQAWSYARLTHPMTVFAIATNGKQTRIIDTFSKKELTGTNIKDESKFWTTGCKLSVDEELELRYEALQYFICYSQDNLEAFSRSQVNLRMQTLKGNTTALHKKYIPELCVDRNDIKEHFQDFLQSQSQCFALIGESGVGKTNLICGLAENVIKDHIVLFFNAADMFGNIITNIREDFNWFFSPRCEAVEIVRRLEGLSSHGNYKVCIFIDAIDEATAPNFAQDLNDVVRKLQQFKNIKLCVTCKSLEWHKFLGSKGSPTFLAEAVYKPQTVINTDQEKKIVEKDSGVFVQRFSDEELTQLDTKYRSIFKYRGNLTGEVKNECKLGFMFRIVAEVYEGRELPNKIDDVDVLNEYLNKKLEKCDKELSRNYLEGIGNVLLAATRDKKALLLSDKVEESYLRSQLKLKPSDKLPEELFAYNLLVRSEAENGLHYIGFYYTRIRDYVIAILSLKLSSKISDEFRDMIRPLFETSVGLSVLDWYVTIAKDNHRKILLEYRQSRALLFLNEYVRLIEMHFPLMKDRFEPFTSGPIGIVISGDQHDMQVSYGFRPLQDANDKLLEIFPLLSHKELWPELEKMNVHIVHQKSRDFISENPIIAAQEDVADQLRKIVKTGKLNESYNEGLAFEKAIAIIYNNLPELGFSKMAPNNWLPDIRHLYPISCDEIVKRVRLIYASEYYRNEAIQEEINTGRIKVQRKGQYSSCQIDLRQLNHDDIERKAQTAVEKGMQIPESRVIGESQLYSVLLDTIKTIQKKYSKISGPLLPSPDISGNDIYSILRSKGGRFNSIPHHIIVQYSDDQLKKYIDSFFRTFFIEYKKIIETCFPTIKNKIPFYAEFPSGVYVEADTNNLNVSEGRLQYGYKYDNSEPHIEVIINPAEPLISSERFDRFRSWTMRGLDSIFRGYEPTPIVHIGGFGVGIDNHSAAMCPLRNFIYEQIKNDTKQILEDDSTIG